jgi:hypothetical protein
MPRPFASPVSRPLVVAALACALSPAGCGSREKEEMPRREPPPPPAAAPKPGVCAAGGGTLADAVSAPFFPRTAGSFCLDPAGGDKAFGEEARLPLERICDLFDGECAVYQGLGVRRVVELRYVDGGGSSASVGVYLSRFGSAEGAYAMFTKRVVGDGDPAADYVPKPIEGGARAALGHGNAYVVRGPHLVELVYTDDNANEATLKKRGDELLPALVKAIGEKLPGPSEPPASVRALASAERLPLGERVHTKEVLGQKLPDGQAAAVGYYRDGDRRWRTLAVGLADDAAAKDLVAAFGKLPGAKEEKGIVRATIREGDVSATWLFRAHGKEVRGVGDEPRVLKASMTEAEREKVSLSLAEKEKRLTP